MPIPIDWQEMLLAFNGINLFVARIILGGVIPDGLLQRRSRDDPPTMSLETFNLARPRPEDFVIGGCTVGTGSRYVLRGGRIVNVPKGSDEALAEWPSVVEMLESEYRTLAARTPPDGTPPRFMELTSWRRGPYRSPKMARFAASNSGAESALTQPITTAVSTPISSAINAGRSIQWSEVSARCLSAGGFDCTDVGTGSIGRGSGAGRSTGGGTRSGVTISCGRSAARISVKYVVLQPEVPRPHRPRRLSRHRVSPAQRSRRAHPRSCRASGEAHPSRRGDAPGSSYSLRLRTIGAAASPRASESTSVRGMRQPAIRRSRHLGEAWRGSPRTDSNR